MVLLRYGLSQDDAEDLELALRSQGIWTRISFVRNRGSDDALRPWGWAVAVAAHNQQAAERVLREHESERREADEVASVPRQVIPELGQRSSMAWVVGLMLVNVFVWWLMEVSGGSERTEVLLRFGASSTERIAAGQWWRTVTAVFLHIGSRHLVGNSAMLLVLGALSLRAWGPGRLLLLYVVAGVAGNWAGFVWGSPVAVKAGASGAIMGLLGAFAATRLRYPPQRSRFRRWHVLAMLVAFYGFAVGVRPESDHVAHVGGLSCGALIAVLWPRPGLLSRRGERLLQGVFGLVACAICAAAVLGVMSRG